MQLLFQRLHFPQELILLLCQLLHRDEAAHISVCLGLAKPAMHVLCCQHVLCMQASMCCVASMARLRSLDSDSQ